MSFLDNTKNLNETNCHLEIEENNFDNNEFHAVENKNNEISIFNVDDKSINSKNKSTGSSTFFIGYPHLKYTLKDILVEEMNKRYNQVHIILKCFNILLSFMYCGYYLSLYNPLWSFICIALGLSEHDSHYLLGLLNMVYFIGIMLSCFLVKLFQKLLKTKNMFII